VSLSALDTGSGPVALLLHGQPGTGADWSAVTQRLRGRMRAIAPDRPGYGSTGGRAVGFRANAERAMALLDRLQIDRAVVVGHSWGSGVALAAALEFPRRLCALVLVGPMVPTVSPSRLDRAFANRLIGPPAIRLGFRAAGLGLALPPLRRLAHAAAPALEPDRLDRVAAEWRGADVWRSFYAEQRAFVDEMPALARRLPSLNVPTTIVAGNRDRICPPSQAHRLASDLPSARLIEVDGGHLLPQQRPDAIAEAITAHRFRP
jgi:pimeloyl-ACP methyl ester carboxylesterase